MTTKVLYVYRPEYGDNYTDETFLSGVQRNTYVEPPHMRSLLRRTQPITQHLSCVFIYVSLFMRFLDGRLTTTNLLSLSLVLSLATRCLLATDAVYRPTVIPLLALYLLSPVLKTLTRDTASDSIWAVAAILLSSNVLLSDYRSDLQSTLALTAGLSASIVLASRLSSNTDVFSLLLFSTLWFGPLPHIRRALSQRSGSYLTAALSITSLFLMKYTTPLLVTFLAALALLTVAVISPVLRAFLLRRYKNQIHGPWDEAQITM